MEIGKYYHKALSLLALASFLSFSAFAQGSYESYKQGRFEEAFEKMKTEVSQSDGASLENQMDMAQDVFAQSTKIPVEQLVALHELAATKKITSYLQQRISSDVIGLKQWENVKKLSPEKLLEEIEKAATLKETLLAPNHEKRSRLRIYGLMGKHQYFLTKQSPWLFVQAKANYLLTKGQGGLELFKKLLEDKGLPEKYKKEAKELIKTLER